MSANNAFYLDGINTLEGFVGRTELSLEEWGVAARFIGEEDSYIVSYRLPETYVAAGIAATLRLRGWSEVKYLAVGYTLEGKYCHIKTMNVREDAWVDVGFRHDDIIFKLQNSTANRKLNEVSDIKIFLKGTPCEQGGYIDIAGLSCPVDSIPATDTLIGEDGKIPDDVLELIIGYLKRSFRDYQHQAVAFMRTGDCPVPGKKQLSWQQHEPQPKELAEVNTYRFSWHAQHPAIQLLLLAEDTQELAPVLAARSFIEQWLVRSFYQEDQDIKFAWYDHGTAERLLAFLLMWQQAVQHKMDVRFLTQLKYAIIKHAELLSSEAFYAYNQPERYHNHAWFQDAALVAVALSFPECKYASRWLNTAIARFDDQLKTLIVRDSGYAIFVENSIGYHHGVQSLAEFAGNLVALSGRESEITKISQELVAWSDFLRYPDGRAPAQGDTFRLAPRTGRDIRRGVPWESPSSTILPKAGYVVVKGNHDGKPWMLCLFNTSLSKTHKHEDNLSITFWFDGIEWLIDPSFYSHEYEQATPKYLRSASAHNTISFYGNCYNIENIYATLDEDLLIDDKCFAFSGSHGAYSGCKIERVLKGSLDLVNINVTDRWCSLDGEVTGYLNFIVGEGVVVTNERGIATLVHASSNYQLKLKIESLGYIFDKCKVEVGQGFMESYITEKIQVAIDGAAKNSIDWVLFIESCVVENQSNNTVDEGGLNSESLVLKQQVADPIKNSDFGRVLLVGSCVTRDALSFLNTQSIDYFARTSLISLVSSPVKLLNSSIINSIGDFEKRMILSDFDKRLFNSLDVEHYDLILLDFIDERFDLVKVLDSYVTNSNYLIQSDMLSEFSDYKIYKRFEMMGEWKIACEKFINKIKYLNIPVILHKAWWADSFYNYHTDKVEKFEKEQLATVKKYNSLLSEYYNYMLSIYPELIVIEVKKELLYSDFAHKWGRDYFHYSELYYRELARELACRLSLK